VKNKSSYTLTVNFVNALKIILGTHFKEVKEVDDFTKVAIFDDLGDTYKVFYDKEYKITKILIPDKVEDVLVKLNIYEEKEIADYLQLLEESYEQFQNIDI